MTIYFFNICAVPRSNIQKLIKLSQITTYFTAINVIVTKQLTFLNVPIIGLLNSIF